MACDCIERANIGLSDQNAMVKTALTVDLRRGDDMIKNGTVRVAIDVMRIDESQRYVKCKPWIMAEFCPFCGIRYIPLDDTAAESKED